MQAAKVAQITREQASGTRTVQYTIIIETKVKPETTDDMFMAMVKANFSEKLQKAIIHEDLKNVD